MNMSDPIPIEVKNVTAPTLFFIRLKSEALKKSVKQVEREISKYVATVDLKGVPPAIGSVVGFFHVNWITWIRAEILSIERTGWFKFLLMDYGYTMLNNDMKLFCELPEEYKKPSVITKQASLVLKPCEIIEDSETNSSTIRVSKYWSDEAIKYIKSFDQIGDSREYCFQFYGQHTDGTWMGDLIVNSPYDPPFSVSEKMIAANYAMKDDSSFKPPKKTLPSLPIEPVANFQVIYSAFHPDYKKSVNKHPKTETEVAGGVHLGSYTSEKLKPNAPLQHLAAKPTNTRLSQLFGVEPPEATNVAQQNRFHEASTSPATRQSRLPETSSHPTKQVCSTETYRSAIFPLDILVFANVLRAPFKSIENTAFRKEIKANLRTMSKIQSYSYAQIHHGRSMLIIGDVARSEPAMDYLPAIVNLVQSNRSEEKQGIGSVAVVIAKNKAHGASIAKALKIVEGISVVEALNSIDKIIVDFMNGCDFLVTTPAMFGRIIDGVSWNVFDKNRLKHVIFDGIDGMMNLFQTEVNAIIRACTSGRSNPEKNPQIIVTSNIWMKEIEIKLLSLMSPSKTVLCIDNFIEAAAFVGCKFSVAKPSLNLEDKLLKLVEHFKQKSHKKLKTIVVTNNDENMKIVAERLKKIVQVLAADKSNSSEVKTKWSLENGAELSVLVTNDAVLSKMELRNVQNLIHFDVPKSWSSFVNRFGVLMEQIYKILEKTVDQPPVTKVFLDDDNVDQFAEIINFLHVRKLAKIPEIALEHVKRIKQFKEEEKCENKVKVCSNIYQFGECPKHACQSRHIFCEADKSPLKLPPLVHIKFDLVTVNNPSSFAVKVKSYFIGKKWISLEKENSEIEQLLKNDLQSYCGATNLSKVPSFVTQGETYAVQCKNQWSRCKVIDNKNSAIVQSYLIDNGYTGPFKMDKLRVLPEKFKTRPLIYNLQVVNAIPLDREQVWDQQSTEKVKLIMKNLNEECSFSCKIILAVQDVLFTESFDAMCNVELMLRLKNELKKESICDFDKEVELKLRKLAEDCKLIGDGESVSELEDSVESETTPSSLANKHLAQLSSTETEPIVVKEVWKQLSCNEFYEVEVKHFKNPESFFVVIDMSDKKFLQKILLEIESSKVNDPLRKIEVGAFCAVKKDDKVFRSKIISMDVDEIKVLLLDHGEMLVCHKAELHELSQALLKKLPLQTIHCRMIGIRPKFGMKSFPPLQSKAIHQLIKCYKNPLKMFVAKKNEKIDDLSVISNNSYEVILIDPAKGKHLDSIAVSKRIADLDEIEKPIEEDPEADSETNENSDFTDKAKDLAVLADLIDQMMYGDASDEGFVDKEPEQILETSDETEQKVDQPVIEKEPTVPEDSKLEAHESKKMMLNYIHKQPKIEWSQNEVMIRLQISAVDCQDYGIKICESSIDIVIKYQDRLEKTSIELYGSVIAKLSSHELCGLSIIVRLPKFHPHMDWPRLTANQERSQFISFNSGEICENQNKSPPSSYKSVAVVDDLSEPSDDEELQLSDDDIE